MIQELNEQWKDVAGYEGLYQVSNFGRVKHLVYKNQHCTIKKERILVLQLNHKGYEQVSLGDKPRKNITVHRLVASAFIPNPSNLPQVNHKDGNKRNNRVDNLEWCDNDRNMHHAKENGLLDVRTKKLKKPILQYDLDGNLIKEWSSARDAMLELNINESHIRECCRGTRKTAGKFRWRNVV